jgi:hypothetical protein
MKTALRHSLSLTVAAVLAGYWIPDVYQLASTEWTVFSHRNSGILYCPWYEKDVFSAIAVLWTCDMFRQLIQRRLMRVRFPLETVLLVIGFLNFRMAFIPPPYLFLLIAGSAVGLFSAIFEEIRFLTRPAEHESSEKKEPIQVPETTRGK